MIKDIILSFKENIKQKTTNPFFGTLILVWIIHNWELIYTFFNFEPTRILKDRIDYLSSYFSTIPFIKNLLVCVGITFAVLIITYIFLNLSRLIINVFEKKLTPWIYKITDKSSVVLKEDYQLLQTDRNRLFSKVEEERTAKLKAQGEVTKLEEKISELLTSDEISLENIIDSENKGNTNDNFELLPLILESESKRKIFDRLIDTNNNDDWFQVTKDNMEEVNYFLRANIIKITEKGNNSDYRKYTFTDYGNSLKREYINKTLHNTV